MIGDMVTGQSAPPQQQAAYPQQGYYGVGAPGYYQNNPYGPYAR